MHELSIAGYVLDAALRHAGDGRVVRVGLRVGRLRQVVPSALEFAWSLVTTESVAAGSALEFETVEPVARCNVCGAESVQQRFPMLCGVCASSHVEIVRGEELSIEWVEVERDERR